MLGDASKARYQPIPICPLAGSGNFFVAVNGFPRGCDRTYIFAAIGIASVVEKIVFVRKTVGFLHKLLGSEHFDAVGNLLYAVTSVIRDCCIPLATFLRGDEHDSIGRTRTINRRRRRILENLDGWN